MARTEDDWGRRRPARRSNKPYNDDYKENEYEVYEEERRARQEARRRDDRRERDPREARTRSGERSRSSAPRRDERARERDPRDSRSRSGERSPRRDDRVREQSSRNPRRTRRPADYDRRYEEQRRREYDERYRESRRREGRGMGCLIGLIILLIFIGLAALAVIYMASLWGKVESASFKASDVSANADLPASVAEHAKNYRQFMIFGVDSRDNTTLQKGALADSNILCTINKKTGEITLTSIYRDTYVETTTGETMKLTEVYSKYGAEEQLKTINKNFDLNLTEYITVNWNTVASTINELGGIDVNLSEEECSGINKYINEVMTSTGISSSKVSVSSGTQHLDGVQAVTYCRLRKGLGDDYKRTERQRTVITLTLEKAKSSGIPKVLSVCNDIFPGLSSSFSLPEVVSLGSSIGSYRIGSSTGFPYDMKTQDGGRYYLFADTLASNATALHQRVYEDYDYTPSGTVNQLSASVSAAAN